MKYLTTLLALGIAGCATTPVAETVRSETVESRLANAYANLHNEGSAAIIRRDFPDLEEVYVDDRRVKGFPDRILPFRYFYSEEADRTFSLCNIEKSVLICKGKLDHRATKDEVYEGRCVVTPYYIFSEEFKPLFSE